MVRWIIQLSLVAALLLILTPTAVANRCRGESSGAVKECACTVRNRLLAGWSEGSVLDAYYAPDALATPAQVQVVDDVLKGKTACGTEYFMYSEQDTVWLGISSVEPVLTVRYGSKEVRFFERWFRKRGKS